MSSINWSLASYSKSSFLLKNEEGDIPNSNVLGGFVLNKGKGFYGLKSTNPFYPIFIYKKEQTIYITNSLRELSQLNLKFSINLSGLLQIILFNSNSNNKTPYNELSALYNVSNIRLKESSFELETYYHKDSGKLISTFNQRIAEENNNQNRSNVGLLSGGGESRINASILGQYPNSVFFTWGNPKDKEFALAKQVNKKLGKQLVNVRPDIESKQYEKTLYENIGLVNPQYTYRIEAVRNISKENPESVLWTGWGDINGYPTMYQPSELFTEFFLGLFKGEFNMIPGFNKEWLASFNIEDHDLVREINDKPHIDTFFNIKQRELAPRIFGQVLSYENTIMPVFAPWFHPDIYQAVHQEEEREPRLRRSKAFRSVWKGELYYQLIKQFNPALNRIKHAKGYYPWMLREKYGLVGLSASYIMKKIEQRKKYPFDRVENLDFIKEQLLAVYYSAYSVFDKECVLDWIKRIKSLSGVEIFNALKVIQVYWILEKEKADGEK